MIESNTMSEKPNTPAPKPSPIGGLIIIAVIIFICYLIFSPSKSVTNDTKNPTSDNSTEKTDHPSPGQQLADLELKENSSPGSAYSKKLDELLNVLSKKYQEPADTVADQTFKNYEVLKSSGINLTFEYILNDVNQIPKMENTSYKDVIGLWAYTTLKINSKK